MTYVFRSFHMGIFALPIVSVLLFIPYVNYCKKKLGVFDPVKAALYYSFILYVLCTAFLVSLPYPTAEELAAMKPCKALLMPFRYFTQLARETGFDITKPATWYKAVFSSFAAQYIFNVVMMIPLGIYLRSLFKLKKRTCMIIFAATTLIIELSQLTGLFFIFPKAYRYFETDDLITNFTGGCIGYWLAGKLQPRFDAMEKKAAAIFRQGRRVNLLRRLAAWIVDADIVLGVYRLAELVTGRDIINTSASMFARLGAGLMVYTVICTQLMNGATVGSWLFRYRAKASGKGSGRLALLRRQLMLYIPMTAVGCLYLGLERMDVSLMNIRATGEAATAVGLAILTYHVIANQMFPSRGYPWETASGTVTEELPSFRNINLRKHSAA